jgi:hypothetical protein
MRVNKETIKNHAWIMVPTSIQAEKIESLHIIAFQDINHGTITSTRFIEEQKAKKTTLNLIIFNINKNNTMEELTPKIPSVLLTNFCSF